MKLHVCMMLSGVLLSACASTAPVVSVDPDARPAWVDNPGEGVSASAGMHVRGRVAQEELVISRARVEYAKRFGVTIESIGTYSKDSANGRSVTTGSQVSQEQSKQVDVKAVVKAKWHDRAADVLWVWLVPGN